MTVLTDELPASFDDSVGPVDEARLLPPVLYTSAEFYEFERRAVFQREWLCVGRVDQLKEPGDFRCITIAGEPLIAARDAGGELRVMSAVCRHRGMVIAEGSGNCRRFTCPYHHWSYGLDGALLGTPAMERAVDFDHSDHNLPELKVEIWQGFIMANFDHHAPPFGPTLTKIDDMLTNYGLESTTTLEGKTIPDLPWNWKVMMENFNDPYHASQLHGPLQTFAPSHMNDFLPWDDADGAIGRIQHFTDIDSSFNPTQRCILPVFSNLTTEQRKRGGFVLIPPTLALAIVPDEIAYFIISPQDAGHITIQIGYCLEPSAKDAYNNAMASGDFVVNVTTEVFRDRIETVAMEAPSDVDEYELAGWTPVPATKVTSPAIGEALARLECEVRKVVDLGTPGRIFSEVHLVIAEVVWVAYDTAICDPDGRIDPLRLGPIGRLGLRTYLRTVDDGAYFLARTPWSEFIESDKEL